MKKLSVNNRNKSVSHIQIHPKNIWNKQELDNVKNFIKAREAKRTQLQKINTKMLGIKYRLEDYINSEKITARKIISMESFIDMYLKVLNITFKKFAQSIDTTDGNLKKYLSGDRKFTADLAFKFGAFFHTTPDLWMRIYVKNELLNLKKENSWISKYKKYDYEKVCSDEHVKATSKLKS